MLLTPPQQAHGSLEDHHPGHPERFGCLVVVLRHPIHPPLGDGSKREGAKQISGLEGLPYGGLCVPVSTGDGIGIYWRMYKARLQFSYLHSRYRCRCNSWICDQVSVPGHANAEDCCPALPLEEVLRSRRVSRSVGQLLDKQLDSTSRPLAIRTEWRPQTFSKPSVCKGFEGWTRVGQQTSSPLTSVVATSSVHKLDRGLVIY